MLCPLISNKELAYMCKYENDSYEFLLQCLREEKQKFPNVETVFGHFRTAEELDYRIKTKWLSILEQEENQFTLDDFWGCDN